MTFWVKAGVVHKTLDIFLFLTWTSVSLTKTATVKSWYGYWTWTSTMSLIKTATVKSWYGLQTWTSTVPLTQNCNSQTLVWIIVPDSNGVSDQTDVNSASD